ncbi:MAG: hypothetical protein JWM80_4278 [Cyanobacteria bacterium RYN_339]|nr:hypothetical protein [Cyanobacteria bacterium RYN_339]
MGAWILRAARDRQIRLGGDRRGDPVVITPPAVGEDWRDWLHEAGVHWAVSSNGTLSSPKATGHHRLAGAIENTDLLAIDEAHNYINKSGRTNRVLSHYADNVVLFTATPINRGASDLLGLVELLGADNFSDVALDVLRRLQRIRRSKRADEIARRASAIRDEIQTFLVRRTRGELNSIVEESPARYQLASGRLARFPDHENRYYELPLSKRDERIANKILQLVTQLRGVSLIQKKLALPAWQALEEYSEAGFLERLIKSQAGLAQHTVLDCLRSSKLALYEHIHGTDAAIAILGGGLKSQKRKETGNVIKKLTEIAGRPPRWGFKSLKREAAESWLWDKEAHRQACERDAGLYHEIGEMVRQLSDDRENWKIKKLVELRKKNGLIIAFDSRVLTLDLFRYKLEALGEPVTSLTGVHGQGGKRRATALLGLGSQTSELIALCSDAFSEGLNLQHASTVIHLNTPTVVRDAEQRAGRVDRMDSAHERVEVWWPKDRGPFAPRGRELLRDRLTMVHALIGGNVQMPVLDVADDEVVDIETIAELVKASRQVDDPQGFLDAFKPIRELLAPETGLVPADTYDRIRRSQAAVRSRVSIIESVEPWAFFAVNGGDRGAPRWVFLDSSGIEPVTDLGKVAEALRQRLVPGAKSYKVDELSTVAIEAFTHQLEGQQRLLLPRRRQRALALADQVMAVWLEDAHVSGDTHRQEVLEAISRKLGRVPDPQEPFDLRAVADAWLQVLRPIQKAHFRRPRSKSRPWLLQDLKDDLLGEPIPTAKLELAFRSVPMLPPVGKRIVATIIGLPGPKEELVPRRNNQPGFRPQ